MTENKAKIILAVIGAIAAIFAAFAGNPVLSEIYKERRPTATATMVETNVVEENLRLGTVSPEIITTQEQVHWTPLTELPGDDWKRSCINSEIWSFFASEMPDISQVENCYQLLDYGISAHQGNLAFVRTKVRTPETYGILVPIPNNAEVSFHLRVNELENAEIWAGIVKSQDSRAGRYLVAKKDGFFDIVEIKNSFPSTTNRNYEVEHNKGDYRLVFLIEGNQWDIHYNDLGAFHLS